MPFLAPSARGVSVVSHLGRITEAVARGHRAGQVVAASEDELAELLQLDGRSR